MSEPVSGVEILRENNEQCERPRPDFCVMLACKQQSGRGRS